MGPHERQASRSVPTSSSLPTPARHATYPAGPPRKRRYGGGWCCEPTASSRSPTSRAYIYRSPAHSQRARPTVSNCSWRRAPLPQTARSLRLLPRRQHQPSRDRERRDNGQHDHQRHHFDALGQALTGISFTQAFWFDDAAVEYGRGSFIGPSLETRSSPTSSTPSSRWTPPAATER